MYRSPIKSPRGFNPYIKPIEGVRSRTQIGGVITVLASSIACILFLSQIFMYFQTDVTHKLDLAPSIPLSVVIPTKGGFSKTLLSRAKYSHTKKKKKKKVMESIQAIAANSIDVNVKITFPKLSCHVLDYSHNGDRFSNGEFAKHYPLTFKMTRPTEYDYAIASGSKTEGKSKRLTDKSPASEKACTIKGKIPVPRILGDLSFTLSEEVFAKTAELVQSGVSLENTDQYTGGHDTSHYIHEITFGKHFDLAENPLKDTLVTMNDPSGVGLNQMSIRVVPTIYKRFMRSPEHVYQLSSISYLIKPEMLLVSSPLKMPGLNIHYDFNPIEVTHVESRENLFVFLSSLIEIVGGVFVTVGLVSSAVVTSAQTVLKKQD